MTRSNCWCWWSQSGSNRRPSRCKRDALPAELWPQCSGLFDPVALAAGLEPPHAADPHVDMVGLGGVEPPTSPLSGVRSNQLSYRPPLFPIKEAMSGQSTLSKGAHSRGRRRFALEGTNYCEQVTCEGARARRLRRCLFKGGDPAARSRTATLLRLHPSH